MAENKNMELNDEMMTNATGGAGDSRPEPKFNIGDKVVYVVDNSELIIESMKYAEGSRVSEWLYIARDPSNSVRSVSGPDKFFRAI